MPRTQCESCGEEFANEYKLFRHERECTLGDESAGPGDQAVQGRRVEGTVSKFLEEDGYGFIVTADRTTGSSHGAEYTQDVFVHVSDTDTESLEEGDRLRFNVVETEEGLKAENVTRIERSSNRSNHTRTRSDTETARRMGFGHQVDDTRYGRETEVTEQDINDFDDERKFR